MIPVIEMLLAMILIVLVLISLCLMQILERIKSFAVFDPNAPCNKYGEGFSDAIQNAHARGLRGIDSND